MTNEKLSNIEQDLVVLCDKRVALTNLSRRVGFLADEVKREDRALLIRAGLTTQVAAEVEQAQAFLAALSQKLAELQQEQAKELGVETRT